jgi:hypothetical protein
MEGVGSALGKVGSEAVAANVLCMMPPHTLELLRIAIYTGAVGSGHTHLVLIWQRRHGARGKFARQHFPQIHKVREAPADGYCFFLERWEIGLHPISSLSRA